MGVGEVCFCEWDLDGYKGRIENMTGIKCIVCMIGVVAGVARWNFYYESIK